MQHFLVFFAAVTVLSANFVLSGRVEGADCQIGGCSSSLCIPKGEELITTCEWTEYYGCFADADAVCTKTTKCEWQLNGTKLQKCLIDKKAPASVLGSFTTTAVGTTATSAVKPTGTTTNATSGVSFMHSPAVYSAWTLVVAAFATILVAAFI